MRNLFHVVDFATEMMKLYTEKKLARAAAALAYYLTTTFFPMIVCIYTLLGNSYDKAQRVLLFAKSFLAESTYGTIAEFLRYVALNHSTAMMIAGLSLLVTSASAAFRTIQSTIGELQGEERFHGAMGFVLSIVFSVLFVFAFYFMIIVMFTGKLFFNRISVYLPVVDIASAWMKIRFPVLAVLMLGIFIVIYTLCKPEMKSYSVLPGACFSAVATVAMSLLFSLFFGASTKYSLVYGSLTSIILLMMWLYFICIVIFIGAAFNIVLRNIRR